MVENIRTQNFFELDFENWKMSENQFESKKKKFEFEPAFAEFHFAECDEMTFRKYWSSN